MKKVLFVSNVLSHIYAFHLPFIEWFKQNGYEVHILTNAGEKMVGCFDKLYDVGVERSPFSTKNISAYRTAKKIIESEKYDIVHCHTPMGGVIGRLASKTARKDGGKVLYTAHGFHFYKGAPLLNWLLYYSIERALVKYTDAIITINGEDYSRLKKMVGKHQCKYFFINGVGVNTKKYHPCSLELRIANKEASGYKDKVLLFYAAEFIKRKNHKFLIENFYVIHKAHPNTVLLLAGKGKLKAEMEKLVQRLSLDDSVRFLGFRKDIPELLSMIDINISTSFQEGLPINVVEGIASACPELVSNIRGNIDVVKNGYNGFVYQVNNSEDFCEKAIELVSNEELRVRMSDNNLEQIKKLNIDVIVEQMGDIYMEFTGRRENDEKI